MADEWTEEGERQKDKDFLAPASPGGNQSMPVSQSEGPVNLQLSWEESPIRKLIVTQ